jgi:hypothetical protein
MTTPTDQQVARLNLAIADQTSEISRLSHEYRTALTAKSLLDVKLAYYSLASHIRKPWHAIAAWPLFVFAIGPCIVAALILIATNEATNSWQTATLWSGLSAAVSVLIFAVLPYGHHDQFCHHFSMNFATAERCCFPGRMLLAINYLRSNVASKK